MENKQQTAVDWLFEELKNALFGKSQLTSKDILDQAKAMEKEQIETAYNAGREFGCKHDDPETGEQYYNQTHGKE